VVFASFFLQQSEITAGPPDTINQGGIFFLSIMVFLTTRRLQLI